MIRLAEKDVLFLLEKLDLPRELRHKLEQRALLTEDEADDLRNLCGDRLAIQGFDLQYNPTREGRRLEDLIDKLYTG